MKKPWWGEGLRFQCQQSGKCCVSHGEYGFVYLTKEDRRNIAQVLGMKTAQFTKKYCTKTEGAFHLKDDGSPACVFLKNKQCQVYEARPTQCRTWPFWPETMSPKSWKKDVVKFCPGVGKGRLWSKDEISKALKDQKDWEHKVATRN